MKIFSFTGDDSSPLPANVRISAAGFGDGQPAGELTGLLQLRDIEPSWAGGSIQLTLFRPSGAVTGGVIAEDAVSLLSPEREYGDRISMVGRIMLPQGITHLILHIDPMLTTQGNRAFDFSRIREFTLNLGASVDAPVYVRHLRICAEHDAVGAPVIPAPGDSISCLQNQNQSCYTYLLEEVKPTAEIHGLQQQLQRNMARLRQAIRVSQMGGRQTLYAEAVELVADIALTARRLYPWTNDDDWRRQDLTDGLRLVGDHITELDAFARGMVHADDEDDSNIPVPAVPDLPVLSSLRIDGNTFVDGNGRPTVLYAMNYHHHGPLLKFFAPDDHRVGPATISNGPRYTEPINRMNRRGVWVGGDGAAT